MAQPANPLEIVRRLAANEERCAFFRPVVDELKRRGLDDDDLLEMIRSEPGEVHCYRSKPTEKYYPETVSDYYSIWLTDCGAHMFLKLLVDNADTENERLVITSFKKDDRHDR